jgi:hypothetical protein
LSERRQEIPVKIGSRVLSVFYGYVRKTV